MSWGGILEMSSLNPILIFMIFSFVRFTFYSIVILSIFFVFGQINITHASTPISPTVIYPPSTWTTTIPSGSINFQWSYSGNTTNIWFYFYMLKWDSTQSKWITIASEYEKTNSSVNKFLSDGYYAWQ